MIKWILKKYTEKKFIKLTTELDELLKEIKKYNPNARYYVASDTLNLMKCISYDNNANVVQENVIESKCISGLDCGDW